MTSLLGDKSESPGGVSDTEGLGAHPDPHSSTCCGEAEDSIFERRVDMLET